MPVSVFDAAVRAAVSAAAELRDLIDAAHAKRMYVILDIVLNHAGDLFTYGGMGNNPAYKPDGAEYPVQWRDSAGTAQGAWADIAQVAGLPREAGVWPK